MEFLIKNFNQQCWTKVSANHQVVKAAKECMEDVITEGTGRPAFKDMPFAVAGKTGTAHVADGNIKYDDGGLPGIICWIFSC